MLGFCVSARALAAGTGADAPRDSIFHAEDLSFLSIGVGGDYTDRQLQDSAGNAYQLEGRYAYGFLGVDITRWLSINGGAGETQLKPGPGRSYGNEAFMWTAGGKVSFWEHEVTEPSYLECTVKIQGAVSYWDHNPEVMDVSHQWTEWRYELLGSAEFPSGFDPGLNNLVSTVFYAGVAGSEIEADQDLFTGQHVDGSDERNLTEDQTVGPLLGIDLNIARNFSVGLEVRFFEDPSYSLTGAFHF
jgi:hypothetical protein